MSTSDDDRVFELQALMGESMAVIGVAVMGVVVMGVAMMGVAVSKKG